VTAFNAHDAAALAAHWSPEAVYANPDAGNQGVGHEAIEKEFDALLTERKGDKLNVDVKASGFLIALAKRKKKPRLPHITSSLKTWNG